MLNKIVPLYNIKPQDRRDKLLHVQGVVNHFIVSYYIKWVITSWTHSIFSLCNIKMNFNQDLGRVGGGGGSIPLDFLGKHPPPGHGNYIR